MASHPVQPGFEGASLTQVRLTDGVLRHLSEAILDGRLLTGASLPSESRLSQQFGVSKQVVREALRQLSGQGLLEVGQGRTTKVRALDAEPLGRYWRFAVSMDKQGLAEAVELRRMAEPAVARLAARRHTSEQMAEMHDVLARMDAARGDPTLWMPADLDFHDLVARMAGNRLVLLQMRGLAPVIRDVLAQFNARMPRSAGAWADTWTRHAQVATALAARDPDEAERAMLNHFEAAEAAIAALFPHAAAQEETKP